MRNLHGPRRQRHVGKLIDSPVGELKLVACEQRLVAILWKNENPRRVPLSEVIDSPHDPLLRRAERQLREYFAGERREFELPLDPRGTEFQKRVWRALLTIGFGETRSYARIAAQIGCPAAVRAVGAANGRNPLSIVVPCHRVVGSNGQLTGFAGGLEAKAKLLSMEREIVAGMTGDVH